ncbi:hypothetical protein DPMN_038453 [Dreissena polymorpha]|uniref:Uncharacterized protein n=1 Tax=Dreissena polymorpha TaxID=45954 RepID=A0A9D4RQP9_DREPO|nr:hypothetical protein DPMN_038453 [Dreissena polymorpha]
MWFTSILSKIRECHSDNRLKPQRNYKLNYDLEGLEDFLTNHMRITYRSVKFLVTSREDCKVAQIVVDTEQAEKIAADITWPEGISCRPLIQRKEYVRRFRHETNRSSSFTK